MRQKWLPARKPNTTIESTGFHNGPGTDFAARRPHARDRAARSHDLFDQRVRQHGRSELAGGAGIVPARSRDRSINSGAEISGRQYYRGMDRKAIGDLAAKMPYYPS